ncbi:polyprenyl synthetase family protein [Bdellovibrio sp. HCB117]|uniref:polyprenyl synthetase family protein n=1 Tax=Bdellovibrio sp. HCB117 TaxID=3394359 RepID=UPI0039B601A1
MNLSSESDIEFPQGARLRSLLQLSNNATVDDLLEGALTAPLKNLLSRPRKNLRSTLVDLGISIAKNQGKISDEQLHSIAKEARAVLEILHTGSLVIDDIQDGSTERRGAPAVHILYGLPVALNAGNWMYFLPFKIISGMPVSDKARQGLSEELQNVLLRAHYGQAIDVGTEWSALPQGRIPEISMASMELKTGALSELASKFGPVACEVESALIQSLGAFGKKFGIALQMFDDIGNVCSSNNEKKWIEDTRLKRLTFVIATAAEVLSTDKYAELKELTKDSDQNFKKVREFLIHAGVVATAKARANSYLQSALNDLESAVLLTSEQKSTIEGLQHKLMKAYE